MHTPGMADGEQTADQPKTPTETAPPPGGSARARAQQDNRDQKHDSRHGVAPPPRPPQVGTAALTGHRTR